MSDRNPIFIQWTALDSDDNAESVATRGAPGAGRALYVTDAFFGFSAAPSVPKLAEIVEDVATGNTTKINGYISGAQTIHWHFDPPLKMDGNLSASARLAAGGTGGIVSRVVICGYTGVG